MVFINEEEAKRQKEKRMQLLIKQLTNSDCIKFSMNIPRPIHKKLKICAAREGKDMKDVIMSYILKYLENFM